MYWLVMLVVIISFICSAFCNSYDFVQFSAVPNANIVCFVNRQGHSIVCNSHDSGCIQPDCLHFLGCKEGSRLRLPRSFPLCLPHCAARVCIHPGQINFYAAASL
jgi:hypothetical protein